MTNLVTFLRDQFLNKLIKLISLAVREFIDINGTSFFIDTINSYLRDEAKTLCESIDMTMVTFDTEEKWTNVMTWLQNSGEQCSTHL